jgi:hypothetical protein
MPPADRRKLTQILESSTSDEEAKRRLAKRLRHHERERAREREAQWAEVSRERDGLTGRHLDIDDESGNARHRGDDGSAAMLDSADFESGLRPADLVGDDGKGYDRR